MRKEADRPVCYYHHHYYYYCVRSSKPEAPNKWGWNTRNSVLYICVRRYTYRSHEDVFLLLNINKRRCVLLCARVYIYILTSTLEFLSIFFSLQVDEIFHRSKNYSNLTPYKMLLTKREEFLSLAHTLILLTKLRNLTRMVLFPFFCFFFYLINKSMWFVRMQKIPGRTFVVFVRTPLQ